jgi:hypothetical protein
MSVGQPLVFSSFFELSQILTDAAYEQGDIGNLKFDERGNNFLFCHFIW